MGRLALALVAAGVVALTGADLTAPSAGVVVVEPCAPTGALPARPDGPHYAITVDVARGLRVVSGSLSVRFTPERSVDRLVFRLWPNGPRQAPLGARLSVTSVMSDGKRVPVSYPTPTTLVARRQVQAGVAASIAMRWRLRLPRGDGGRLHGGSVVRLGSFFPILAWDSAYGWQLDPPTVTFGETSTSPTAVFDVRVAAPRGLRVLASGRALGGGRWRAVGVRDFAIAVGRFDLLRGVARAPHPVRVVVGVERESSAPAPRAFLRRVVSALESYAGRFGPYPGDQYTLALMADLTPPTDGIEYPTLIFQGFRSLRETTPHEVAHQWFYSLVGNNQARDPWLDEALATWADVGFRGALTATRAQPIPSAARNQLGRPMTFWDTRGDGTYYAGVYVQGVQALAALGDPATVDCSLRLYIRDNAYEIAEPRDLLDALGPLFPAAEQTLERYGAQFDRAG